MKNILALLLILNIGGLYSQNYTIKTDSVMNLVKYEDNLNYTEFKASTAIITIIGGKCLVEDLNGVKSFKISSCKLLKEGDITMLFNCKLHDQDYILKLIIQSDKKKLLTISNGIETKLYTVSSLSKS